MSLFSLFHFVCIPVLRAIFPHISTHSVTVTARAGGWSPVALHPPLMLFQSGKKKKTTEKIKYCLLVEICLVNHLSVISTDNTKQKDMIDCPHISIWEKRTSKKKNLTNKCHPKTTPLNSCHLNYQLSTCSITYASESDMCTAVHSNGDLTAPAFNHISNEGNASWLCQPRVRIMWLQACGGQALTVVLLDAQWRMSV